MHSRCASSGEYGSPYGPAVDALSSADLLRRSGDVRYARVKRLRILTAFERGPQQQNAEMIPNCTADGVPELAVDTDVAAGLDGRAPRRRFPRAMNARAALQPSEPGSSVVQPSRSDACGCRLRVN